MVVAYEGTLETEFYKMVVYEVVAYGRWLLLRSGCYEGVDCSIDDDGDDSIILRGQVCS